MGLSHSPKIVTDGLVLYLDAANQKSYPGSGTTWSDISGNGNNATLTNGPTYNTGSAGSIVFDGVDDVAQTSYAPQFNDFTVIAWFNSSSPNSNSYNRIVDKNFTDGMWIGREGTTANKWGGGCIEPNSPWGRYITLNDNEWHMIVSRREGTTHTIYGDGVSNSVSGTVSSNALSAVSFAFGAWTQNSSTQRLQGKISNVLIYSRALSETEIKQNFEALRGRFNL